MIGFVFALALSGAAPSASPTDTPKPTVSSPDVQCSTSGDTRSYYFDITSFFGRE